MKQCLLFVSLTLFLPAQVFANVVINEIAWMGTENSYNDEWIELYNDTDSTTSLEGWILKAADGTPDISLAGTISANGFYLLERTDETTVPGIAADQIYIGALGNGGENLQLYDGSGSLADSVNSDDGWFAGDNSTKQTMERLNPETNNWGNSNNPGGTPRAQNSVFESQQTEIQPPEQETPPEIEIPPQAEEEPSENNTQTSESSTSTPDTIATTTEPIIYPLGIIINEILPSPEGPDEENEWIEIFNKNDFVVDLTGWQMKDKVGKVTIYIFPDGAVIGSKAFLVLSRPTTKITLNNSGDGLFLLQPDNEIVYEVAFEKALRGESYNFSAAAWAWSPTLTPGSANIIPAPGPLLKEGNEEKNSGPGEGAAAPEQGEALMAATAPLAQDSSFFLVFLVAGVIALFSAGVTLFLKTKVKRT